MKLAINGAAPVSKTPFPVQISIGNMEREAVLKVLDSKVLSGYLGVYGKEFFGGPEIVKLEKAWAEKFNVEHAVACNSATSGIWIACQAIGLKPDDIVFVSPYSMSCSATIPVLFGAIPYFIDIEPEYQCLSVDAIIKAYSAMSPATKARTKAIIIVDLFGSPFERDRLLAFADTNNLIIIEDAAQAIGATYKGDYAGTLGHIGIYSLNFGKHISCGEGGVIVSNDDNLALNCRLAMNHGEVPLDTMQEVSSIVGMNLRMTELQATIASCQLQKLDGLIEYRLANLEYITAEISAIPAIEPYKTRDECFHSYYVQPWKYLKSKADGIHRDTFIDAVKAELPGIEGRENEGPPIGAGYVPPICDLTLFKKVKSYGGGNLPVCRHLHNEELWFHRLIGFPMGKKHLDIAAEAFWKVWDNREELR